MTDHPLISCIMPTTRKRDAFLLRAIRSFNAQNYPNKELIVVTDDDSFVAPAQENISYTILCSDRTPSIGAKRNLACSLAHGELICSWDDDDRYGPSRLTWQSAFILAGEADCSAMKMSLLLDVNTMSLWSPSDDTHRKCFKQDVHYGTLMFRADYWRNGTVFPSVNVGEDRRFVHALLAQDARLAQVVDPASFIYVLHGGNTTSDMRLVHPDGWTQVPMEQYVSKDERAFYASLSTRQPASVMKG